MSPTTPAAQAAAEAYAQEQSAGCADTSFFAYKCFLAGHAWTLQHLSEQGAGEFDEAVAEKAAVTGSDSYEPRDNFVDGARWQHAQSQLVIQALSRNNLALGEELEHYARRRAELVLP